MPVCGNIIVAGDRVLCREVVIRLFEKSRYLKDCRLYLILDAQVNSYDRLFDILEDAVRAGVDIVQLRDKHGRSRDIFQFARKCVGLLAGRIPFIVNDRVDIAVASGADGVHLGQDDLPISEARKILGQAAIIGISCQSLAHAQTAERAGADYIGFGSVFKTLTKPDREPMDLGLLARVCKDIHIPVFAIGGIGRSNLSVIRAVGVNRAAVCRAVCQAKDIAQAVKDLKSMLCNAVW